MIPLPLMRCDSDCGACCTIVQCKEHEYQAVLKLAKEKGIEPKPQGATCPFYQEGQCAVYEARPWVCRMFGHFAELPCPRGYNVNVPPLLEKRLRKSYLGKSKKLDRFLHEALGEGWNNVVLEGMGQDTRRKEVFYQKLEERNAASPRRGKEETIASRPGITLE